MKKTLLLLPIAFSLVSGAALAERVRDWHDLGKAHKKVEQAIFLLSRAQRANHYEMGGHANRAVQLLKQAEHELHEAIEAKQHDRR